LGEAQRPLRERSRGARRDASRASRLKAELEVVTAEMFASSLRRLAWALPSEERMVGNKHAGVWGLFHELGHNHQSADWTFAGAGEVTVNLFTLYIFDKVCGACEESRPNLFGDS